MLKSYNILGDKMHIEIVDDFNMIIYLNNIHSKLISNNKEDVQDCFRNLFSKLKNYYNININGFYNIKAFKDKYYGMILELSKEDIDYIEYFDGQVDMNITFETNCNFLYEIEDYFNLDKDLIKNIKLYKYKGKFYIQIIKNISSIDIGKIIEFSKIIYDDTTKQIIKRGSVFEIDKNFEKL